jgi:hypothetical protein
VLPLFASVADCDCMPLHHITQVFVNVTVWKWYNVDNYEVRVFCIKTSNFSAVYCIILLADLEFKEAVYPFKVSVYETYSPGSVVRIWARVLHQGHRWLWKLLWEGEPQHVGHTPRVFSPMIQTINVPTK